MKSLLTLFAAAGLAISGSAGILSAGDKPAYEYFELLTASSPNDSRSKEWKPGDGIALEVSGMEWIGPDRLAVAVRKGEIWFIEGGLSKNREDIKYHLFASGLHEPLGLTRDGDDLLVAQRCEITRLRDANKDGVADAYLTEADGWAVTGNYHAYTYGPERDGAGNLWVTLNLGMGELSDNSAGWHGWGGIIGSDGRFSPRSLGMRSPSGLGANRDGEMFFTDQQGTWIPATPVYHLRPGVFYGNQESLPSLDHPDAPFRMKTIPPVNVPYPEALASCPEFVPPAVWLPYNKMGRSATDIQLIDEEGRFGPFDGQLLVGEFTNAAVNRVFLEKIGGQYQGACFPFLEKFPAAVVRLAFAPDGSLFVGMTNRGWSSLGNRSYGLIRVNFTGAVPFSIREMRAKSDGFELVFTEAVDLDSLAGAFAMSRYTYRYSSAYGGDEIDTRNLKIVKVIPSDDGLAVRLIVEGLRSGYVHELRTSGLKSASGRALDFPNAYYTLNHIPE
ncbi:MAG: hypothetical protein GXX91_02435 [Verrucomicrobiaceae bacterium]|nr:hypothetical protein [Verrucomicrobiaceae bacterium]